MKKFLVMCNKQLRVYVSIGIAVSMYTSVLSCTSRSISLKCHAKLNN